MPDEVELRNNNLPGLRPKSWAEGPVLTSGLIGALVVAIGYAFVMPFVRRTELGSVLIDSRWVGKTIFTLAFWALALLVFKWRSLLQLNGMLHRDLLPTTIAERITPANAPQFIRLLQCHWVDCATHPLTRRLTQSLAALASGHSRPEIQQLLRNQADSDLERLEGSFSLVRTFIWSAPILGFIGTVLGIGSAIGGFSASLGTADDLTAVKSSLGQVIKGLAFSFQATFVGLVASLVLVFVTNWRHKAEIEFLTEVGDYCERNFMSRILPYTKQVENEPAANLAGTLQGGTR